MKAATPRDIDTDERLNWNRCQRLYWSQIAQVYDCLYAGRWSELENRWVASRLKRIPLSKNCRVVDLASGTGLGHRLMSTSIQGFGYVALDISSEMLLAGGSNYPKVVCDMTAGCLRDASADVVLALFTSASYAFQLTDFFQEVGRLLKPGGFAHVSLLSEWAVSRSLRGRRVDDVYRTRGYAPGDGVPAHLTTPRLIRTLAGRSGLHVVTLEGLNSLSGVLEAPGLWFVGRALARLIPASAHSLEIGLLKREV